MMRNAVITVVAGLAAVSLTACGSQTVGSSSPSSTGSAVETSAPATTSQPVDESKLGEAKDIFAALPSPVPGEIRVSGVGADIVPVSGVTPVISQADALARAKANSLAQGLVKADDAPSMMLATYTNVLGEEKDDGSMTPSVPAQLAWVLVWHKQPPGVEFGPIRESPRPVPDDVSCDVYLALSATTGEQLDTFRYCTEN
jgi:hypothetical protein